MYMDPYLLLSLLPCHDMPQYKLSWSGADTKYVCEYNRQ